MTIFRSRGFDTLIGKGTQFIGSIHIASGTALQLDGSALCSSIIGSIADGKVSTKTMLRVNGELGSAVSAPAPDVTVHNVVIAGKLICNEIRVEGTLAVKSGAYLKANKIYYRDLVIETGAVVHGQMFHLDHVAEGESV